MQLEFGTNNLTISLPRNKTKNADSTEPRLGTISELSTPQIAARPTKQKQMSLFDYFDSTEVLSNSQAHSSRTWSTASDRTINWPQYRAIRNLLLDIPKNTIALKIEGNITPKARPRFNGRAYLPSKYRNWKEQAIAQIQQQLLVSHQPISKCGITLNLYGSLRGDLDNLAGAILDSLVQSGAIADDRLSIVRKLCISHEPSKIKGCQILIEVIYWKW